MRLTSLLTVLMLGVAPASALACGDYMSFRTTEEKVAMMRNGEGWRAQSAAWSIAYDETVDAQVRAEAFFLVGIAQWKNGQQKEAVATFREAQKHDRYVMTRLFQDGVAPSDRFAILESMAA